MANLFVVGDSFVSIEDTQYINNDWVKQVANQLGVDKISNNGVIGSGQDFSFYCLQNWEEHITPDDYLIVVLTHPARYWFFADKPDVCKIDHIENFEDEIGVYRAEAAKLYFQYIQREQLDTLHLENRIAWLSYTTQFRNWRTPLLICGIEQPIPWRFDYQNINIAKGNLTLVSCNEIKYGATSKEYFDVIKYNDPRYNHLCLSNHTILADKVVNSLTNNTELDLTTGFNHSMLTLDAIDNEEFQKKELSPNAVKRRQEYLETAKKDYRAWRIKSLFKF